MGVAFREVLRRALVGELLLRTMANQAAAIFDGGARSRHLFAVASRTVNHSLGVQMVGIAGVRPGGELQLDCGHVAVFRRSPGIALSNKAEALAGHICVAGPTFHMQLRTTVSQVNAG